VLLRISPRRTLCESTELEEILEAAFGSHAAPGLELELSTYQVDAPDVARIKAEHAAAAPLDPPDRGCGAFNLQDLVEDVRVAPGISPLFAFLNGAHRNAHFNNEDELRAVVARVVEERRVVITAKAAVAAYARTRLEVGDVEWTSALDQMHLNRRQRWQKFCGL